MQPPSGPSRRPDPSRALAQYRRRADHYDLELAAFEPVRREAIALLDLQAGDSVLDVGCGTGLSFEALAQRIGPTGHVIGIEPSPEMLAHARERIARKGLARIALVQADAGEARLHGHADAALFHFTHDVLQDPAALDHVLSHLKRGAHVVAAGLKWAPAWLLPVNVFVLGAALYSVSCLEGLDAPWQLLGQRLRELHVRTLTGGALYIASGRV
jgi:SAM-dependent methyltransferase